jgi:hypothetical protein
MSLKEQGIITYYYGGGEEIVSNGLYDYEKV